MFTQGRRTMQSNGALLPSSTLILCTVVLFHARSPSVTANNLSITQTRITSNFETASWPVEGVATVELGGEIVIGYYMDCTTSANDGQQLRWSRVAATNQFEVDRIDNGSRMTLGDIEYTDLGEYQCVDDDNGDAAVLNITNVNPAVCPQVDPVEAIVNHQIELAVFASTTTGPPTENRVTWLWPNGQEIEDTDPRVTFQTSRRRLILSGLTTSDAGSYTCRVIQVLGTVISQRETAIQLIVFVPSAITQHPSPTTVNEWEDASLTCIATGSTPLTVTWKRTGSSSELPVNHNVQEQRVGHMNEGTTTITSTITISQVRYADGGQYYCEAHNQLTMQSNTAHSDSVELTVTPVLRIEHDDLEGDLIFASEGTTLDVDCYGSGGLSWQTTADVDISTSSSDPVYTVSDPSRNVLTLHIPNFMGALTATYTCVSDLVPGLEHSIFITNVNPAVFISTDVLYALQGDTVYVNASIHTTSQVSIQWYWNGTLLDPASDDRYSVYSDSSQSVLTIHSFGEGLVGRYEIVVSNMDDVNSTDGVSILFSVPASAAITPSQVDIHVGERAELTCVAGGSEPFEIMWSLGDGSRLLPDGVSVSGSRLTIAAATRSHSNTYVCTVSNIAGQDQATAVISVLYPPLANITYDQVSSHTHTVTFSHGEGDVPIFTCTADGNPPPSLSWQLSGGAPLPSGAQETLEGEELHLSWTRPLDFSDSGDYVCVATNQEGESTASVHMTVVYEPVIDTIFPAPGVSSAGDSALHFSVPLEFTGSALTCSGFAWPPPTIQWMKSSGALPSGVSSVVRTNGGIMTADLVFTTPFSASSVGMYRCEVRSAEGVEENVVSQLVELFQGSSGGTDDPECGRVTSESLLFQLRVSSRSCNTWTSTEQADVAEEFQSFLYRLMLTECDCDVSRDHLTVVSLLCSDYIDGGVVFRGSLETNSSSLTEKIFCTLFRWQRSGALVSIEGSHYAVDSQCSLEIDSYDTDECAVEESDSFDLNMILVIAIPSGVILLILVLLVLVVVCSLCRCCSQRRRAAMVEEKDSHNTQAELQSFTRTDSHTRFPGDYQYSQYNSGQSNATYSRQNTNPYYEEANVVLQQVSPEHRDSGPSPDRLPLVVQQNIPPYTMRRENETSFTGSHSKAPRGSNSPPHGPLRATVSTGAQPYQIPTASTGSLTRVGTAGATNPMWAMGDVPTSRGDRRFSEGPPSREEVPSRGDRRFSEGHPLRTHDPSTSPVYRTLESPSNKSATTRSDGTVTPSGADTLNSVGKQPLSPALSADSANPPYSRLQFRGGEARMARPWYESSSEVSVGSSRRDNTYTIDQQVSPIHPYATVRNSHIPTSPIAHTAVPVPPPGQSPVIRPQQVSTPVLSRHYPNGGLRHSQEGVDSHSGFPHVQHSQTFETIVV